MSEAMKSANAETPNAANAETEVNTSSSADADSVKAGASEVNTRILSESKKYKERMVAAEKRIQEIEQGQAKEKGEYKALYENLLSEHEAQKKNIIKERVGRSVGEKAAKAGCIIDTDKLLVLGNRSLLEYDAETGEVQGVDQFLEDVKKSVPSLFQSAKPPTNINAANPGGYAAPKTVTANDVAKMKDTDKAKNSIWASAMNDLANK